MRRKEREINSMFEIWEVIQRCDVCHVAFFDEEYPYVVPLNFGATLEKDRVVLYFHGVGAGKKVELMKMNNHVAFNMNGSHRLIPGNTACEFTMAYESVSGTGVLEMVKENEKIKALDSIMSQYTSKQDYKYDENAIRNIAVLKLTVNDITGKRLIKAN